MVAQNKGGVGKTTIAVHTAIYLHDRGHKVALFDCDRSASSAAWATEAEPKIKVVHSVKADRALATLKELRKQYDFVICDSPGEDNKTVRVLMMLADKIVFPVGPSILELRALVPSISVFDKAKKHRGGKIDGAIVCNMVRKNGKTSKALPMVAEKFGLPVAKKKLRHLEAFREAPKQATVVTRMGLSTAMVDFEDLMEELLGIVPACYEKNLSPSRKKGVKVANG